MEESKKTEIIRLIDANIQITSKLIGMYQQNMASPFCTPADRDEYKKSIASSQEALKVLFEKKAQLSK